MKILFKILFFLFAIFQTNISEAKAFVFEGEVFETTFSNTFNYGKNSIGYESTFSENDFGVSCKNESVLVNYKNLLLSCKANAAKTSKNLVEQTVVHGNSLKSHKPTWGYKLYSTDGTFLKNGITSKLVPESRYTKSFMSDKFMEKFPFPNRKAA